MNSVTVKNVAITGEVKTYRVVGQFVISYVIALTPVDLQTIRIVFKLVTNHGIIITPKNLNALRWLWVGFG
ncbi:hypothetical protein D3C71_1925380 [compost metagenome]